MQPLVSIADPAMASVRVELENNKLWSEFYSSGTEMVITKSGRRMFPSLKYKISGLDSNTYYFILMDIVPADEYRYKFMGKCWVPAYKSDSPQHEQNLYMHPDSPALGSKWMSKAIGFHKIKLTNNNASTECHITLNSMHKYIPRLHIFAGSDIARLSSRKFTTFSFPETTFMAVTAYQNESVTSLKIKNNPFARRVRELNTRSKRTFEDDQLDFEQGRKTRRTSDSSSPDIPSTPPAITDPSMTSIPRPIIESNVTSSTTTSPSPSCPTSSSPSINPSSATSFTSLPNAPQSLPPTYPLNNPFVVPSPTYDVSSFPQRMDSPQNPCQLPIPKSLSPPTYLDFISSYESMFGFNPFYSLPRNILHNQPQTSNSHSVFGFPHLPNMPYPMM